MLKVHYNLEIQTLNKQGLPHRCVQQRCKQLEGKHGRPARTNSVSTCSGMQRTLNEHQGVSTFVPALTQLREAETHEVCCSDRCFHRPARTMCKPQFRQQPLATSSKKFKSFCFLSAMLTFVAFRHCRVPLYCHMLD